LTPFTNPSNWPQEVTALFERAITCEYASLTEKGSPITFPLTPYIGDDGRTLDVSTGLTYPAKAERARRNPKVTLLYSDPVGSGLPNAPTVLVYGLATVRDADLQANIDRYIRLSFAKLPDTYKTMPGFLLRRMNWYFARIWMQVTPVRMLWWPGGNLDQPPQRWDALAGTSAPPSDPPPQGKSLGNWTSPPGEWRPGAEHAARTLGAPVLTVVNEDGWPLVLRTKQAALETDGFRLTLGAGMPLLKDGSACLTFHTHPEQFTGQENMAFTGEAQVRDGSVFFKVGRRIGDWSLNGSRLQAAFSFLAKSRVLRPRLVAESARRGQPVPKVNLP
jgi:hypothetical protein